MQFSCATPTDCPNNKGYQDVWVCNSDGYVGHMCLLSLQPEPIVTLNTPVPGCNARILCICAVPAFLFNKSHHHRHQPPAPSPISRSASMQQRRTGVINPPDNRVLKQQNSLDNDEIEGGYASDSSSSTTESDMDTQGTESDRSADKFRRLGQSVSMKSNRSPSPSSQPSVTSPLSDPFKSTMWLGTEDGCIHIFQTVENIKTTKTRVKIQLNSPVLCIMHVDQSVFASTANGDLIIYKRDKDGHWDTHHSVSLRLGSGSTPVNKMLPVAGKIWCAIGNDIMVVNHHILQPELTFTGNPGVDKPVGIHSMVCSGQAVWVAGHHSARLLCYHATSYLLLFEINITQTVAQKLSVCDDIIRQHKMACLRITCLLLCKDLVWVGTSAGVIVTIPIPKGSTFMHSTRHPSLPTPTPTGLLHGHTGHVRFLTAVDNTNAIAHSLDAAKCSTPTGPSRRRMSVALRTSSPSSRFVVISGGDGYEDFRGSSQGNTLGKDDSTNHLLLWHV